MKRLQALALVLTFAGALQVSAVQAGATTARKLPPPARVDCGEAGVSGAGFSVFACSSGAGGTRYAHGAELLVVRATGSYTGYHDAFSQADLIRKTRTRGIVASHNNAIVEVTAFKLVTLISTRQVQALIPTGRLGWLNALRVDHAGDIFFNAGYYAPHRHGCEDARAELTASGELTLLRRSRAGLTCG